MLRSVCLFVCMSDANCSKTVHFRAIGRSVGHSADLSTEAAVVGAYRARSTGRIESEVVDGGGARRRHVRMVDRSPSKRRAAAEKASLIVRVVLHRAGHEPVVAGLISRQ